MAGSWFTEKRREGSSKMVETKVFVHTDLEALKIVRVEKEENRGRFSVL